MIISKTGITCIEDRGSEVCTTMVLTKNGQSIPKIWKEGRENINTDRGGGDRCKARNLGFDYR